MDFLEVHFYSANWNSKGLKYLENILSVLKKLFYNAIQ